MDTPVVPNRSSRPTILLRRTWREEGRVRKATVGNITNDVTLEQALLLRRVLKGEPLVAPSDVFEVTGSKLEGHVQAVLKVMKRLGMEKLLASRPSKERSLLSLI